MNTADENGDTHHLSADHEDKEVLTISEVASLLEVSPRTIERYVEESRIPFFRLQRGRRGPVRFLRSQLIQWLSRITVKPIHHQS